MTNQWIQIHNDIEYLEDLGVELLELFRFSEIFNNLCIGRKDLKKEILNLFEARSYFESCLILLKSFIEPNDNPYIKEVNAEHMTHDVLEKYFENLLSILDADQIKMKDNFGDSKLLNPFSIKMSVKMFREKIIGYQNDLILFPIYNSIEIFKKKEKSLKKDVNKREVFEYILFSQVFISAKIKGSPERQKTSKVTSAFGSSFHETNIIKQGKSRNNDNQEITTVNPSPPDMDDEFPEIFEGDEI